MASCSPRETSYQALGMSVKHAYFTGEAFSELVTRFELEVNDSVTGQAPKLYTWLGVRKQLGSGTYGDAFLGNVGGEKDAVVIKMNNTPEASEDLKSEFTIQQYMNLLREVCPNFALGLSIFKCPMLVTDKNTKVPTKKLCKINNAVPLVNFIVIEKVSTAPGITHTMFYFIHDFYEKSVVAGDERWYAYGREVILSMIIQIAYALDIAQKRYHLVHQDMHVSNYLVQSLDLLRAELGEPKLRNVNIDYGPEYGTVLTGFIPVIIDFGTARILRSEHRGQRDERSGGGGEKRAPRGQHHVWTHVRLAGKVCEPGTKPKPPKRNRTPCDAARNPHGHIRHGFQRVGPRARVHDQV